MSRDEDEAVAAIAPPARISQLDGGQLRRRLARAAAGYDNVLAAEVSSRLAQRLDCVRLAPARLLDLGCGAGGGRALLAARYPAAAYVGADFLPVYLQQAQNAHRRNRLQQWLKRPPAQHWCAADAAALPFAGGAFDLVWSNFLWHWLPSPLPALAEVKRVLSPQGVFFFSALGPNTLRELRAALGEQGARRVHEFADLHDLGDALLAAGLREPVMEMEEIELRYRSAADLWRDLRHSGATNARQDRPRHLGGRQWLAQAAQALHRQRGADGRFGVRFEILYGHAWGKAHQKPAPAGADFAPLHFVPRS